MDRYQISSKVAPGPESFRWQILNFCLSQNYLAQMLEIRYVVLPSGPLPSLFVLFWFFGDFRCGALLFMVIHVIYKYKNK